MRALKDYGSGVGMASTIMLGVGYAGLLIEGGLGMEMGALGSETMIGGAEVLGYVSDVTDIGTEFLEKGTEAGLWKAGIKLGFKAAEYKIKNDIYKMNITNYEKKVFETGTNIKSQIGEKIAEDAVDNANNTSEKNNKNQEHK